MNLKVNWEGWLISLNMATGVPTNDSPICRLWIILLATSSGLTINDEKYKIRSLFLKWYPWYNMLTIIYRKLLHGHIII